jgi:hypothetical protein
MRSALPLAVLSVFTVSTLPVQAFPGASVNLVRVSADGVRALPGLELPPPAVPPTSLGQDDQLLSQADLSSPDTSSTDQSDVTYLLSGDEDFEIRYASPLPANLTGNISIRRRSANASDGTNGEEVESIPLSSDKVTISEDRLTLTIKHDRNLRDGETLCALLPDGPHTLPQRLTPCCFQLAKAATSLWVHSALTSIRQSLPHLDPNCRNHPGCRRLRHCWLLQRWRRWRRQQQRVPLMHQMPDRRVPFRVRLWPSRLHLIQSHTPPYHDQSFRNRGTRLQHPGSSSLRR